jgi:glycosyltransferase involved in cell wall biosynthesis
MSPPLRIRRILMTTDCVGGVFTFTASLARDLAARGVEVDVVTLGPRPQPAQRAMLEGCERITLTETDLLLEWQDPEGLDDDRARAELAAIAAWLKPDLIHLNSFREARFAWPAPVVVVAHSCVNTWADACGRQHDFRDERWERYRRAVTEGLACADRWVAPSASFAAAIARSYAPPQPGHVIHNGTGPAPRPQPKQPFVLAAGRLWDHAKNLAVLIETAAASPWPIRIAGPDTLDGNAAPGNPAVNLQMLGTLPHADLRRLMSRAAVFVSPARYEPFGLAVLEAAAAGCALVLAEIGSFRELWDGAALFVPAEDPAGWRAALDRLAADKGLRLALQQAARDRAGRYALARTASAYLTLYDEVARMREDRLAIDRSRRHARSTTHMEARA